MKQFKYVIKDPVGIHARPAGLLVKEAKKYPCQITLQKGDKSADATKLMAIMGLGIKCGEEVTFLLEGEGEEEAATRLTEFVVANM